MNADDQRIAIANACGWKHAPALPDNPWGYKAAFPHWSFVHQLPDYLHDLNAMREAALFLRSQDKLAYALYHKELEYIVATGNSIDDAQSWQTADATSAQRAAALLKAFNLWTP